MTNDETNEVSRFWFAELLSLFGFEFFDAGGGGEVFGHGAAEFFDGLANFFADFKVGAIGGGFALDFVAAEFFFSLSGAEEIGGEFSAAHVVEDLLGFLEPFALVDGLGIEAGVEAHVAVVLKDGIVDGFDNARVLGGVRELSVVLADVFAEEEAAAVFRFLVGKFLAAGLHGEIGLARATISLRGSAFWMMR
jgi:hypothetical protein